MDCLGRMFLRLIRSWCSAISSKITWHVDQIHWLRTISIPMERKSKFHWITSSKVAMNPSTMEKRNCFWKSRSVVTCINSKTPPPNQVCGVVIILWRNNKMASKFGVTYDLVIYSASKGYPSIAGFLSVKHCIKFTYGNI